MQGEAYSPRALGEQVVKVVKQFAAGRSQHDDIALVGFGRTAGIGKPGAEQTAATIDRQEGGRNIASCSPKLIIP